MQERRRYVRLNIALEVIYSILGKEDNRYKSITKNISAGGVRFNTEKEAPKGAAFLLEIKIPNATEVIPIKAKIVWAKKEVERVTA